jgi:hypothetical protein
MLDGDDEGGVEGDGVGPEELGAVETLGKAEDKLESPVECSHTGPEEGALLKLGLLEGAGESCAETLSDTDGELEWPIDGSYARDQKKGNCSKN